MNGRNGPCPLRPRERPRMKNALLCRAVPDGETRTRTGDTTIFRQILRTLEQARRRLQIAILLAPD